VIAKSYNRILWDEETKERRILSVSKINQRRNWATLKRILVTADGPKTEARLNPRQDSQAVKSGFQAAASILVCVASSLGAVVSGIALTKGDLWGRGDLGWHHRFVWPAFGLLMVLAVWRLVVRDAMSRTGLCLYLILMLVASGFVAAAGYFGGEILLNGGVP
jgi:hypothetical protein